MEPRRARSSSTSALRGSPSAPAATPSPPHRATAPSPRSSPSPGPRSESPAYMAPEQMAGIAADARSDQFSFCVALFEAVHGVRPFVAPTYEEMIEKIRAGALSQPRPAPDWLQSAISRGLHYDPEQRFPAMYDLIRELSRRRFSARFVAAVGLGALAIAGAGASGAALLTDDTPACDTSEARIETVWGPPQRARVAAGVCRQRGDVRPRSGRACRAALRHARGELGDHAPRRVRGDERAPRAVGTVTRPPQRVPRPPTGRAARCGRGARDAPTRRRS